MGSPMKSHYSMDELESKYNTVTALYDYAQDLIATVENPLTQNPEAQIDLVEPLVIAIGDTTDVLSEEFLLLAEQKRGKANKAANKGRIEASLRKLFNATQEYQERAKKMGKAAANIADAIVAKVQRHVEEIVVVFLEFVNLSLASIMHKQQLEAVKARDPRIALMMHQYAIQQQ
jgi:hypothetical protein